MKALLHGLLAIALLLQGALAVAMPIEAPVAASEMSMPCHSGDHQKKLPCCAHNACACQAICTAIALPLSVASAVLQTASSGPIAADDPHLRAAFRLTPLRPPIETSA